MKTFRPARPLAILASTAFIALAAGTAHAQVATAAAAAAADSSHGTVTGRVYDEATGQSLRGAIVRVVGSNAQDYTLEDGRFQVVVPSGRVTLQIEYVGLDTATYSVDMPQSGHAEANIGLTSSSAQRRGHRCSRGRIGSGTGNQPAEDGQRHRQYRLRGDLWPVTRRQHRLCAPTPAGPQRRYGSGRVADGYQHPRDRRRL